MTAAVTDRSAIMQRVRRVVIKVGSGIITSRSEGLLKERIASVVAQVAGAARHREVILVTSGAVAAGAAVLGLDELRGIPMRQAAAACGQSRLVWKYEKHFQNHQLNVAQVLLTQDDVANRRRFLNARNTLSALLSCNIIPIVNENDSVATKEIQFGDNDTLSALVAQVVDADLLLMLSDVDGLYSADPNLSPDAERLSTVSEITDEIRAMAGGPLSAEGTGGMITKVAAAERLANLGIPTLLIDGTLENGVERALNGDAIGTLFAASGTPQAGKKQWLSHVAKIEGTLHLDSGAVSALRAHKKSLLPSGIRSVDGQFEKGAGVRCVGPDGVEVARGLSNFDAADIERIRGCHSREILEILGRQTYTEVIHRNNLSITS